MFVTNWISTTKIQKISEITNFFRHYFLSRTEVNSYSNVCKLAGLYAVSLNHLDSLFPFSSINHDFLEDDGWVVRSEGEGVDAIG